MFIRFITTLAALAIFSGTVHAEPLKDIVERRVKSALTGDLALVDVDLPQKLSGIYTENGKVFIHWQRAPRAGKINLRINIRGEGEKSTQGWVRLDINAMKLVLVANRDLKADEVIIDGDLRLKKIPVRRGQGLRLSPSVFIGKQVLRGIVKDAPIAIQDIEMPAPVARGTPVRVLVIRGRVRVETRGILEMQARPGAVVSVRLISDRRVIRARLLNNNTVLMEGTGR